MKKTRPINRYGRPARATVWVLATIAFGVLTAARADVVDIAWDANGRFERSLNVAPAKFAEVCGKLPAGLKVRWDFESGTPLDFNVHFHVGKEVVFPSKLTAVSAAKDVLDTKVDQDYCWMWSNRSASSVTVTVRLQR
jgi:hypothetical protein